MSPAGHLCLLFASPTHLSHRLNPHKSLQNKTLSSSRGFLGFGSPLEQQAPRHPLSHRYRLASDKAPSSLQCCFLGCPCSISLFHVPALLPAQPRWPQEEDECFGEAGITPLGPTGLFIMFCKCLRVVVCYLSFSTAWISLLSKQFSNRCRDVFPTWSKALALPTHATKPGKSRTPNQTLMWPPQHSRMLPQEGFS